jgi:hypothetical protein
MSELGGKVLNISLLFIGGVIFIIHLVLFAYNKYLFTAFVCLYIITYGILVTVYTYKKKECANGKDFDVVLYFSMFTIALEIMIFIMAIGLMIYNRGGRGSPSFS